MKEKINLIVIMADQLRYDLLSEELTPNIRKLASDGVEFSNCYSACPLCVPARGAFFTGTYPNTNGSLINPWASVDKIHGDVKKNIDNLYTLMENDGRECIHSGKQHLFTEGGKLEDRSESITKFVSDGKSYQAFLKKEGKKMPGGPAFRTLVPEMIQGKYTRAKYYSTPATGRYEEGEKYFFDCFFTDKMIEGLENRDKTKPLFASLMFLAPHPPFDIPEPWYSRIKYEDVKLPENVGQWYEHQSPLQLYNLPGMVGSHYSIDEWHESWRVYMGLVSLLDDCVGRLIEELKKQGIYDESLIIFTSDHGEMLGSHKLFQKMCMYEESVKTPLYIKFPKSFNKKHEIYNQCVSAIDVFPTICDYMNISASHKAEGKSLLPLINGDDSFEEREDIFIQFDGNGARSNFQRCIISDGYKLIADIFKDEIYLELYNLVLDRMETTNLIFDENYDAIAKELINKLNKHMRETKDMIKIKKVTPDAIRKNYIKG